jgi:hypothetical protein
MKIKEDKRLSNLYYSLKQRGDRKFSKTEFFTWYNKYLKLGCFYCGLEIQSQIRLINSGKFSSNRFFNNKYESKNGVEKYGTRGKSLEVDRKDPKGAYSVDNCVLCCYFCNNDKSDVFSAEQYIIFIGANLKNKKNNPRYKYLMSLLNQ